MTSGGASLIVRSCVSLARMPRSINRSHADLADPALGTRSMPTQSPRPRTSATVGTAASRSAAISHEPSSAERRWYVPSRSMSTTSMPIAHASGIAAERRAVFAGPEHPEDVAIGDDGGQRHDPATERLAEDVHVGDDALVLAGERRAGPAETRLDLVRHQEDAALGAELAGRTEVPLGRHDHARLALDRFDEERDRVVIDRGAKRFHISVRDGPEPRGERAEAALRGRIVGEPDDRDRSPVEVPVSDDDLRAVGGDPLHVVAPPPRGLDRGLDGLGSGVHGEHHVLVREVREIAAEHGNVSLWNAREVSVTSSSCARAASTSRGWRCPKLSAE